MLKTLLWKEWRQLRALRWTGLGLGLLVVLIGLVAPSGARQGWIPFADLARSYSAGEVLFEALPMALFCGLWPLMALLMTAQTFAGDRAAGTEGFLLERPVRRTRVWNARLFAAAGSTLIVALGTLAMLALFAALIAADDWSAYRKQALEFMAGGAGLTALCFLGGLVAASLLSMPMAALLLGLVMVAVPVTASSLLAQTFSFAGYSIAAPLLLLLLYPLVSRVALCWGEPAGRGRVRRGLTVLAIGVVATGLLFVASAATSVRLLALNRGARSAVEVVAAPAGNAAFASTLGGWIVDVNSGERTRFFPPPLGTVVWNADGTRVAVATSSGPLGSHTERFRIEFIGADGRNAGRTLELDSDAWVYGAVWRGEQIVMTASRMNGERRQFELLAYDPQTGALERTPVTPGGWGLRLVGPTPGGHLWLAARVDGSPQDDAADDEPGEPYALFEVTLDPLAIATTPSVTAVGHPWLAAERMSRSGRYWVSDRSGVRPVIDLQTGTATETVLGETARRTHWLNGDRLMWTESEEGSGTVVLLTATIGDRPMELRRWEGLQVYLQPSPDGALLLVSAIEVLEERSGFPVKKRAAAAAIYDPSTARWSELDPWPVHPGSSELSSAVWAGPRTLALTGPGGLVVAPFDQPGAHRVVLD